MSEADVDRDIIRFLTQSTFDPTHADYEHLRARISANGDNRIQIYNDWIDEQIAIPQNSLLKLTDASNAVFQLRNPYLDRRDAFWTMASYGKDQLRQRMIFALSEILVIGDGGGATRRAYRGVADYWDMLGEHAFKNYRTYWKTQVDTL